MGIPTSITFHIASTNYTAINSQFASVFISGTIDAGVAGLTISLSYEDPEGSGVWVALGNLTTIIPGYFSTTVPIPFGIPRTVKASFAGDATYDASSEEEETDVIGRGEQQLSALFWVTHYPKPEDIEADTYGYVLCIDPNGVRTRGPRGPLFLLLDEAVVKPGLTDRNGSMAGFLNDNQNYIDEGPYTGQVKHWDMYLIRDDATYILDEDEFWIGIQRGPDVAPSDDPGSDIWHALGGGDGKGAGRRWLMGGYITKRYYVYSSDTRITAIIRGKDYMDLWKDQPFGTPDIPRNYTSATDFAQIAADVLTDANITSGLSGTPFTTHPDWWPGAGTVPANTGVSWVKEFKQEWSSDVMRNGCEQAGWEWQINFRKQVMLYQRDAAPLVAQPLIEYDRNIRNAPEIVMGETGELITHVIVTDGEAVTTPSDTDGWCREPKDWPDISNPNMVFSVIDFPAPPNIDRGIFADQSLTFDDQGHPALCFIKDNAPQFNIAQSFFSDAAGNAEYATLNLDLRKWRRIKLRFRHATRNPAYEYGGGSYTVGTIYRIFIMTGYNTGYFYDFGKGTSNPINQSPQLVNAYTDHDTVTGTGYNEIELLLPEPDINGIVSDANLKGWIRLGNPLNICNYLSFSIIQAEPNPGPYGPTRTLGANITAGDDFIDINGVDQLAGYPPGTTLETPITRKIELIAVQGAVKESLYVQGINGSYYPLGKNSMISPQAQNNFAAASTALYVRVGWTIAFSQLRFERALRYEEEALSPLGPPYRYKFVTKKEMEYLTEAESYAAIELAQEAAAKQWIKIVVDGDPRITIGYRMTIRLDPYHSKVFQNVPMIIDDLEYNLENQVDFFMELMLAPSNKTSKARALTEMTAFDVLFRKTENLSTPKELTKGTQ